MQARERTPHRRAVNPGKVERSPAAGGIFLESAYLLESAREHIAHERAIAAPGDSNTDILERAALAFVCGMIGWIGGSALPAEKAAARELAEAFGLSLECERRAG